MKSMKLKRALTIVALVLLVGLNVLDALSTPIDNAAQVAAARYPTVENCFDGEYWDYVWLQYIHSPRIIAYGCP